MKRDGALESGARGGVGYFGLVGLIVSSCIGSGVFALAGQLANVASPGAALVAWLVCGVGFLFLVLSLVNLGGKVPEVVGCIAYAQEGFGPLGGFVSGWGYWLSGWLGNAGFAVMVAQTLGSEYCLGRVLPGFFVDQGTGNPAPLGVVTVSILLWVLTCLVLRGVESAALLNAFVMIVKVASLLVLIVCMAFAFDAGLFAKDFWGQAERNKVVIALSNASGLGSIAHQVTSCVLVMMWAFIGIEGASVMSKRARRKSDVGPATILSFIVLVILKTAASILPYGVMDYADLVAAPKPATISVLEALEPGWGGAFISWSIIVSILGSWLSFTMFPAECATTLAESGILPASWGSLNKWHSPWVSLLIIGACTQTFIIVAANAADAYAFASSLCTVTIVITWSFVAAYQMKLSYRSEEWAQFLVGSCALLFQVLGVLFTGWSYLLLACIGYLPGIFLYRKGRQEKGFAITHGEHAAFLMIGCCAALAVALLMTGVIVM